jgi:hypothetical protein
MVGKAEDFDELYRVLINEEYEVFEEPIKG